MAAGERGVPQHFDLTHITQLRFQRKLALPWVPAYMGPLRSVLQCGFVLPSNPRGCRRSSVMHCDPDACVCPRPQPAAAHAGVRNMPAPSRFIAGRWLQPAAARPLHAQERRTHRVSRRSWRYGVSEIATGSAAVMASVPVAHSGVDEALAPKSPEYDLAFMVTIYIDLPIFSTPTELLGSTAHLTRGQVGVTNASPLRSGGRAGTTEPPSAPAR